MSGSGEEEPKVPPTGPQSGPLSPLGPHSPQLDALMKEAANQPPPDPPPPENTTMGTTGRGTALHPHHTDDKIEKNDKAKDKR